MPKYSTAFGMDVHLRSTTVCALDADTGEAVTRRFPGNPWGEIAGWMDRFPGPSLAAYESGYLGFAPQRELAGLGVECAVAAVSKIPRSADSVRLGGISGAGSALVRKLAVEGSWCYAAARHQPKLMPRDTGVPLEIRMHGRKGSERLLRRREEMLARGVPAAKANAATAAELVRWLWALGMMCREGAE